MCQRAEGTLPENFFSWLWINPEEMLPVFEATKWLELAL